MRIADHCRFRHFRMRHQRAFNLCRAHAMARHVDHVVDAARDPVIAVRVAAAAVACEIFARIGRKIRLHEAFVIAVDGAHLARPAVGDDKIALAGAVQDVAIGIDDLRSHTEEGPRRGTGLQRGRTGQRADQDSAGLGLPPGVNNRAAVVTDHAVIPFPGFRIDRLADRAEQPQRGARGLFHRLLARPHQRADGGWRGVEDVDLVLVDHLPEARHRRIIRHALKHQRRRAIGERAIDDVAVAGDPADVSRAPVDIAVMVVEHILMRHRRIDEIAAGRVHDALGRARRA